MSGPTMTEEQLANLSDDELMNMAIPPEAPAPEPAEDPEPQNLPQEEAQGTDAGTDTGEPLNAAPEAADESSEGPGSNPEGDIPDDGSSVLGDPDDAEPDASADGGDDAAGSAGSQDPHAGGEGTDASSEPESKKDSKAGADQKAGEKPDEGKTDAKDGADADAGSVDYKAAYERIMGGFKANGKEIKLQSIDEAVQLMQMGANYTKKLQALQPNLKLLKMLENNDLLDEGKIGYLIDISRKDPAALQKLIRESGIDPMDIDTSVEPDYRPGNHQVSDQEMAFNQTVEDVASTDEGKKFIGEVNRTWDKASVEKIWEDPNILRILNQQKQAGVYDRIASEIERRKVLGQLSNVPFIQAYHDVGQEMQQQGAFNQTAAAPETQAQPAPSQPSGVVETRPAQRKAPSNNDRARAASPTKSVPKKSTPSDFNPLAMSDEDFEKNAALAMKL